MRVRTEIILVLVSATMILLALWRIGDVWRGTAGYEDLIPMITLFLASVVLVVSMSRRLLKRGPETRISPTLDAVAAAQRTRELEKWVRATVTLLIVLYTVVWVVRSGDVLMPILLGVLMLVVAWIVAKIVIRILRPQVQGEGPTTS